MTKTRRTSAAIVGLLDAIKSDGIKPLQESDFVKNQAPDSIKTVNYSHPLSIKKGVEAPSPSPAEKSIPYEIRLLNVSECKPWHMANRLSEYLTAESCAELIESIKKVGQQIPVLVRKSKEWDGYDLICGARRLFSCKHLGINVKAAIVELDDKEALLAMDAENRPRSDISPYERACDYKRWVDQGIYKNYAEIINNVGLKKSWFSQLMALSDIPSDVVKAFTHPSNLKQKWGYELSKICKSSPEAEKRIIEKAKDFIGKNIDPAKVFKELKNATNKNKVEKTIEWISSNKGEPLFRLNLQRKGEKQIIFHEKIPESKISNVVNKIKEILEK